MENKKKKKIILITSIGAFVLMIAIVLILFLATDIFKSSQQLFYKYLPQNSQLIDMLSSDLYTAYEKKLSETSYTCEGELNLTYEMGISETEEQQNQTEATEMFKVITEGKVDHTNQKQYNKATLTKNNQELWNVRYLRTGNLYALGSEEIVTKYVAIENNNLKQFSQKLGYQDVSQIPDKIETVNLNQLLQLTEEEKNMIYEKYGTFIVKNISKNHFSKINKVNLTVDGQNYQTKQYTLTLTSQEIIELGTKILQELQKDDQTLNILLNKYDLVAQNNEMTIELLKQEIQQLEEKIKEQQQEDIQIQISLFVADKKLIKTELKVGETAISLNYTTGARESKIVIRNESENIEQFNTIELRKSENEDQYGLSVTLSNSEDAQNTVTLQISRVGNIHSSTIRKLDMLTVKSNNSSYSLKYSNNINFENDVQVEELNQDNSITLNNYSQEELQQLLTAIIQRTQQVWKETITKIVGNGENLSTIENNGQNTNQENAGQMTEENGQTQQSEETLNSTQKLAIDMFNEQFLAYIGDEIQADKVKELLKITRTAIQNQNPIKVIYSGTYNNTAIQKEVTTAEELEKMEIYIVNGKSYKVQGLANETGKLAELTIEENIKNT